MYEGGGSVRENGVQSQGPREQLNENLTGITQTTGRGCVGGDS